MSKPIIPESGDEIGRDTTYDLIIITARALALLDVVCAALEEQNFENLKRSLKPGNAKADAFRRSFANLLKDIQEPKK